MSVIMKSTIVSYVSRKQFLKIQVSDDGGFLISEKNVFDVVTYKTNLIMQKTF